MPIPLKMVRPSVVKHVTVAEHVEVPSMEEVIFDAYVDRHENQNEEEEHRLLVEMHPNCPEGYGCMLALMIVDVANSTTVSVHIFNPHSWPVIATQDSVVGQVEPVDIVSTVPKCENPLRKRGNYLAMRRELLNKKSMLPNKASRVMKGQEKLFAQHIQDPPGSTPRAQ